MRSVNSSPKPPILSDFHRERSAQTRWRVRRELRPWLENLEPRVTLTASALDPSFGQGGVVLGPLSNGSMPIGSTIYSVSAVAVQTDGKIVEVETEGRNVAGTASSPPLVVRRFNADGSVDATFGTNGVTAIPIISGLTGISAPRNLVIEPNGSIVFAAGATTQAPVISLTTNAENFVVRLTARGQLDSTFGTSGEVILPDPSQTLNGFNTVAVQSDGKIVAVGTQAELPVYSGNGITSFTAPMIAVVRLTTGGALDPSFNQTGELKITVPNSQPGPSNGIAVTPAAVALTPDGQIEIASNLRNYAAPDSLPSAQLSRINTDGTLDSSFGAAGTISVPLNVVNALAIQSDGKVVLVGSTGVGVVLINRQTYSTVVRLLPSGLPDSSFQSVGAPSNPSSATQSSFNSLALAANGEILVAGTINVSPTDQRAFVERFLATGAVDTRFGVGGKIEFDFASPAAFGTPTPSSVEETVNSLALTPSGKILVVGGASADTGASQNQASALLSRTALAQILPIALGVTPNDYTGDGKSDSAAELAAFGVFAIRKSDGTGDTLQPFGPTGIGQAIPAPGDYDGDGKTDIAAYLPAYGVLAYRPSSGGPDVLIPFGIAGAGKSIPAPGDYDGDGKTDVAVYLPSLGILAYRPSSGGADVLTQFGFAGAGKSIPAPGDYDGDGKTDIAVYLPSLGVLAYRPSGGGDDVLTQFGFAGAGQTIPAPGDYDGLGKTDIAAYLPSLGVFAYRPSNGGPDVLTQFGLAGAGKSIPAPGDYDGDGKTDLAVYLPSLGVFAYRPSSGVGDVIESFGAVGTGQTVPAASIPYAQSVTASTAAPSSASNAVSIPLTEESLVIPTHLTKKPRV